MTELFTCAACQRPFVAEDAALIERRNGYCRDCTKEDFLKSIGFSGIFLTQSFEP